MDYSVYGALIRSEFPLPELPRAANVQRGPDVTIGLGDPVLGEPTRAPFDGHLADGRLWLRTTPFAEVYLVDFPAFADFVIDPKSRRIWKRSVRQGVQELTVRHLLIDTVLPLFFNSVGRDMIHATAVATEAGVCAFTGPAGAGKSTLAAAFVAAGDKLVCDDCLAVDLPGGCLALPGYAGLRVWPDSANALGEPARESAPVAEYNTKFRLMGEVFSGVCEEPQPLKRIYRVYRSARSDSRPLPRIESLDGADQLMVLVEGSYRLDLADAAMLARQFRYLASLSERVAVKALLVPDDFAALPKARKAVLADLAGDARPSSDRVSGFTQDSR